MSKAQALIEQMRAWAANDEAVSSHYCFIAQSRVNGSVAIFKDDIDGKSDAQMLEMLHNRLVKPQPRHAE